VKEKKESNKEHTLRTGIFYYNKEAKTQTLEAKEKKKRRRNVVKNG